MAKVEWGVKRTCQACGIRFYDLQKSPVACPKCHASYELIAQTRGRRGRQAALEDGRNAAMDDLALHDALDVPEDLGDSAADELIEDTDELSEGLDNMGDVLDHDRREDH